MYNFMVSKVNFLFECFLALYYLYYLNKALINAPQEESMDEIIGKNIKSSTNNLTIAPELSFF